MQNNKEKFSLEEILSIKRAEKPSPDQWEDFNAQLKSRMLQSIIEKPRVSSMHFSLANLAKLTGVGIPLIAISAIFIGNSQNNSIDSTNMAVEIVEIPNLQAAYYSNSYSKNSDSAKTYNQASISSDSNDFTEYATNYELASNLSF